MDVIQTIRETLSVLLRGLGLIFALWRLVAWLSRDRLNAGLFSSRLSLRATAIATTGFYLLFLAGRCWLALANTYVPEPFLVSIYPYFHPVPPNTR